MDFKILMIVNTRSEIQKTLNFNSLKNNSLLQNKSFYFASYFCLRTFLKVFAKNRSKMFKKKNFPIAI